MLTWLSTVISHQYIDLLCKPSILIFTPKPQENIVMRINLLALLIFFATNCPFTSYASNNSDGGTTPDQQMCMCGPGADPAFSVACCQTKVIVATDENLNKLIEKNISCSYSTSSSTTPAGTVLFLLALCAIRFRRRTTVSR